MRCVGRPPILPVCCFVMTVTSVITLTVWTHLYRLCPRVAGSANGTSPVLIIYVRHLHQEYSIDIISLLRRCVCCMQCGASSPGFHCEWQNNYNHCGPCASLVTCPVCRENFMEEDLLLQCQHCDRSSLKRSLNPE